jgi:hypothetical protein
MLINRFRITYDYDTYTIVVNLTNIFILLDVMVTKFLVHIKVVSALIKLGAYLVPRIFKSPLLNYNSIATD